MLEKINLDTPEHIKSNIKKYLIHTLHKEKNALPIHHDLQYLFYIIIQLEITLRKLAQDDSRKFIAIFKKLKSKDSTEWAKAIIGNDTNYLNNNNALWRIKKIASKDYHNFIQHELNAGYIDAYLKFAKQDISDSINSLIKYFKLPYKTIEEIPDIKGLKYKPYSKDDMHYNKYNNNQVDEYNQKHNIYDQDGMLHSVIKEYEFKDNVFMLPKILSEMEAYPSSLHLIKKNKQAPIFLTDSMTLADNIQSQRCNDECSGLHVSGHFKSGECGQLK